MCGLGCKLSYILDTCTGMWAPNQYFHTALGHGHKRVQVRCTLPVQTPHHPHHVHFLHASRRSKIRNPRSLSTSNSNHRRMETSICDRTIAGQFCTALVNSPEALVIHPECVFGRRPPSPASLPQQSSPPGGKPPHHPATPKEHSNTRRRNDTNACGTLHPSTA